MQPDQAVAAGKAIVKRAQEEAQKGLAMRDLAYAKKALTDGEREVREIKRQLNQNKQATNAAFTAQRQKNNKSGQLLGAVGNAKMRSTMSRSRAATNRKLADKKQKVSETYRVAGATLDNQIAALKKAKTSVAEAKVTKTTTETPQDAIQPPPNPVAAMPPPPSGTMPPPPSTPPPPPAPTQAAPLSVADELAKLADLKDRGVLTDDEFAAEKAKLLS